MKSVFAKPFLSLRPQILSLIKDFERGGKVIYKGRNTVKNFEIEEHKLTIKAFRKPPFINKIVYRYFRKSKAERSFEYAKLLLDKEIGTPEPIAYLEEQDPLYGKSYYVSKTMAYDYTFRDLIGMKDLSKRNEILKQFTFFTHEMQEKGIEFLDHSPGNTLIIDRGEDRYDFFLVDLNRMKFHPDLPLKRRLTGFRRLTDKRDIIAEMSKSYSAITGESFDLVFGEMWHATKRFRKKFERKKALKRSGKFWKRYK